METAYDYLCVDGVQPDIIANDI